VRVCVALNALVDDSNTRKHTSVGVRRARKR
jgi:hypothetical protein